MLMCLWRRFWGEAMPAERGGGHHCIHWPVLGVAGGVCLRLSVQSRGLGGRCLRRLGSLTEGAQAVCLAFWTRASYHVTRRCRRPLFCHSVEDACFSCFAMRSVAAFSRASAGVELSSRLRRGRCPLAPLESAVVERLARPFWALGVYAFDVLLVGTWQFSTVRLLAHTPSFGAVAAEALAWLPLAVNRTAIG